MGYKPVEVLKEDGKFVVQVTFREPFEHFFEIGKHVARFENVLDANRLAEKVRAAFKKIGLSRSLSFALNLDHWNFHSSAYNELCKKSNPVYDYPTSTWAKRRLAQFDNN